MWNDHVTSVLKGVKWQSHLRKSWTMSRSSIFHTIGLRIGDERALNYELWSDFCTSYKDLKRSKIRGLPLNEGVNWELPETTTGVILLSTTVISRQKFISTIGNTSGKWTFAREIASSERWYKKWVLLSGCHQSLSFCQPDNFSTSSQIFRIISLTFSKIWVSELRVVFNTT